MNAKQSTKSYSERMGIKVQTSSGTDSLAANEGESDTDKSGSGRLDWKESDISTENVEGGQVKDEGNEKSEKEKKAEEDFLKRRRAAKEAAASAHTEDPNEAPDGDMKNARKARAQAELQARIQAELEGKMSKNQMSSRKTEDL